MHSRQAKNKTVFDCLGFFFSFWKANILETRGFHWTAATSNVKQNNTKQSKTKKKTKPKQVVSYETNSQTVGRGILVAQPDPFTFTLWAFIWRFNPEPIIMTEQEGSPLSYSVGCLSCLSVLEQVSERETMTCSLCLHASIVPER